MDNLYQRWNAKYSEFFVTRWSLKSSRQIMIGKPHNTVQEANEAALRADKRNPGMMHFVDVVRPLAA